MGNQFRMDHVEKLAGFRMILQQLAALYIKRFHNSRRSLKGFFCEVNNSTPY